MQHLNHRVLVQNQSGMSARTSRLVSAVQATLVKHKASVTTVVVLLTSDHEMRRLNNDYRQINETTDVLSFPGPGWPGAPLGEIAISMPFASNGAKKRKIAVATELAYLATHGTLHLLGFDDDTDADQADMIKRMNEVMVSIGLPADESWASLPHGMEAE